MGVINPYTNKKDLQKGPLACTNTHTRTQRLPSLHTVIKTGATSSSRYDNSTCHVKSRDYTTGNDYLGGRQTKMLHIDLINVANFFKRNFSQLPTGNSK